MQLFYSVLAILVTIGIAVHIGTTNAFCVFSIWMAGYIANEVMHVACTPPSPPLKETQEAS